MKKFIRRLSVGFLVLAVIVLIIGNIQFRDRHRGYDVNINLKSADQHMSELGFSKISVTPTGFDTWNDANRDGRYNPKEGDTYNDLNNNGKFDAVWLAGFHQGRPANGVNDSLWARTMVVRNGAN